MSTGDDVLKLTWSRNNEKGVGEIFRGVYMLSTTKLDGIGVHGVFIATNSKILDVLHVSA